VAILEKKEEVCKGCFSCGNCSASIGTRADTAVGKLKGGGGFGSSGGCLNGVAGHLLGLGIGVQLGSGVVSALFRDGSSELLGASHGACAGLRMRRARLLTLHFRPSQG
jgi:hypothetical protein